MLSESSSGWCFSDASLFKASNSSIVIKEWGKGRGGSMRFILAWELPCKVEFFTRSLVYGWEGRVEGMGLAREGNNVVVMLALLPAAASDVMDLW